MRKRRLISLINGAFAILMAFIVGEVPLLALVGISVFLSDKCGLGFFGTYLFFVSVMTLLGVVCFLGYQAGIFFLINFFGGSGRDFRARLVESASIGMRKGLLFTFVAILLGPVFGIPFFDLMGLRGKRGLYFVVLSAILFSFVWVSVYGGILELVV